jgi:ubiquinone/menaquinone biosynthesis C-methylase UbiE
MNYGVMAKSYEELHGEEQLNKLRIIAAEIDITQKTSILDVGSGTGLSAILGGKITGVEPCTGLLLKSRIPTVRSFAENLPIPDNAFDIVLSTTAIHNFYDKEKAIIEMARVSRKQVIVTVLKSSNFAVVAEKIINKHLKIGKIINESHDRIFFCSKRHFPKTY